MGGPCHAEALLELANSAAAKRGASTTMTELAQRIHDLEEALKAFAKLEYTSPVHQAWGQGRSMKLVFGRCSVPIDPDDIKRAARVLRRRD